MFTLLQEAEIEKRKGQAINFFIRGHYANRSRKHLSSLFEKLSKTNPVTFTLYSDEQYYPDEYCDDGKTFKRTPANITELRDAIMFFGPENVYIQVSDEVRADLQLYNLPNPRASNKDSASIIQLDLLSLIAFIVLKFVEIFVL